MREALGVRSLEVYLAGLSNLDPFTRRRSVMARKLAPPEPPKATKSRGQVSIITLKGAAAHREGSAARSQCRGGDREAQPDHHRMGRLLPDRGVQPRLQQARRARLAADLEMGQAHPPRQAEALGRHPVLRHVQPVQERQVAVREPGNRPLPAKVRLDEDRQAHDGRRAGFPR